MYQVRKRRGFTLIEVMYAAMLTAIAAGILVTAMPTASQAANASNMQQKAMNLAEKEMEAIRALGYPNVTPTQLYSVGLLDSTSGDANNNYSFTNSDAAAPDNPAAILPNGTGKVGIQQLNLNLVQVTVTVSWQLNGQPYSYELTTLIANL